jgi:UDP-2-acetamido-2,6-beta-L-arabino-hexul-4-ose reductase
MKTVLVTGANGFIGKNLVEALSRQKETTVLTFDITDDISCLKSSLHKADIIFHLAGVNRPKNIDEFEQGHAGLTQTIISLLNEYGKKIPLAMSSSIQADLDNPYGISKKKAENILLEYSKRTGASVYIYRLTNVFGKWCRPNYNSVVATFCHNISHGLDITISDRNKAIDLVYINDVVESFLSILDGKLALIPGQFVTVMPSYTVTLGKLSEMIYQFRDIRSTLVLPDFSDAFVKCLYATYLSYLDKSDFSYSLDIKTDKRGCLTELIKSEHIGQIFVSKSHGGIIRGNHYHDTKVEKFCVIKGDAIIKFRHILNDEVIPYHVSGDKFEVVDIPPGYTHSIENLSNDEMIVLFWTDQIFNPDKTDTYFEEV